MSRLFISYRRMSSSFMLHLKEKLSKEIDVTTFVDFEDIDSDDFKKSILKHITKCDVFILLVTEHTFADRIFEVDDWIRFEVRTALEKNIPIILACEHGLRPPQSLPNDIQAIHTKQQIEFYAQYFDPAVIRLAKLLNRIADIPLLTQSTTNPVQNRTHDKFDAELYHEMILRRFAQWLERHTPLFAEHKFEMFASKFESSVLNNIPIYDLSKYAKRLVLLGESGSGKSEALWEILVETSKNFKENKVGKIPIKIELRDWMPHSKIRELIQHELSSVTSAEDIVEGLLNSGECLILLDGLNELPLVDAELSKNDLRQFIKKYSRNQFIIACRTPDYDSNFIKAEDDSILPCFEIQRLTREQIKDYVYRYFNTSESIANDFLSQIDISNDRNWSSENSFVRLASIPFLLLMMVAEFGRTRTIPTNKAQIMNIFVRQIIERTSSFDKDQMSADAQIRVLGYLAYMSRQRGFTQVLPEQLAKSIVENVLTILRDEDVILFDTTLTKIWKNVLTNNFLNASTENSWNSIQTVSWLHQLFSDYFLGNEINRRLYYADNILRDKVLERLQSRTFLEIGGGDAPDKYRYVNNHSMWEQPMQLAMGLLDQLNASNLLKNLIELHPRLAQTTFYAQNTEYAFEIADIYVQSVMDSDQAVETLENALLLLPYSEMVNAIRPLFKRNSVTIQRELSRIFSTFVQVHEDRESIEDAFDALEAWVRNRDFIIKFYAAKGLWGRDRGVAASALRHIMTNAPSDSVAKALVQELVDEWNIQ